jgi:hypothetical protein
MTTTWSQFDALIVLHLSRVDAETNDIRNQVVANGPR